jgi:hypothetical protein
MAYLGSVENMNFLVFTCPTTSSFKRCPQDGSQQLNGQLSRTIMLIVCLASWSWEATTRVKSSTARSTGCLLLRILFGTLSGSWTFSTPQSTELCFTMLLSGRTKFSSSQDTSLSVLILLPTESSARSCKPSIQLRASRARTPLQVISRMLSAPVAHSTIIGT